MKLTKAVATAHVASLLRELDEDPEIVSRLGTLVGAAMSFCAEVETYPVFLQYFADSYSEEQAAKLRKLDRELFAEAIQYALAKIDPHGLVEVMAKGIAEEAESRHGSAASAVTDIEVPDART